MMNRSIGNCGDANPNGNIAFIYKGGCNKDVLLQDAYRCTGCGGWFHKNCILDHFKLEAKHDWGRNEERKIIEIRLRKIADQLVTTLGSMPAEQADQIVFNLAYLIYTKLLGLKGKIKKTMSATARIRGKCIDMSSYEFVEDKI